MHVTTRAERIAGALLGVHAGDALGASKEFSPLGAGRARYFWPAGHATDDTALTRAVLLGYLRPSYGVVKTVAARMVDWLEGRWPNRQAGLPPREIGRVTRAGLRRYQQTGDPHRSGAGPGEAGNGSLMRCIPTALAVRDRERRIHESMEISAITHDDPRCTTACAAYNEIAAALLDGASPREAVDLGYDAAKDLGSVATANAIALGIHMKPSVLVRTGQTLAEDEAPGYVLDSLSLAVAAVLDERPFADVLIDVVRLGSDADSAAAIAGGLLGARDGAEAIPEQWLSVLQFAEEFRAAAQVLAEFTGR
jgi:ADP-ribosylglycohydrolase